MRYDVLIIGSFPQGVDNAGGIATSCMSLLNSHLVDTFNFIAIDSTETTHAQDGLVIKLKLAFFRLVKLLNILLSQRISAILIFHSPGLSMLEKGFSAYIASLFNVSVAMFPRGGKIITDHNSSAVVRLITNLAYARADLILCQENGWSNFFKKIPFLASKRMAVVRNWTAPQKLIEIGKSRIYQAPCLIKVLYVGTLIKEKGVYELVDAFSRLDPSAFSLTIVGSGPEKENLSKLINAQNLNNCTIMNSLVSESLYDMYKTHDVFVLPSWHEGLPNVLIESMSAGMVTMATNVGMIPDLITNGVDGFIINPKISTDIVSVLNLIKNNKHLLKDVSIKGVDRIEKAYNPRDQLNILKSELEMLCTK